MTKNALPLAALNALLAISVGMSAPVRAADTPVASSSKAPPPADSHATPVRFTLQLIRTDSLSPVTVPTPAPAAVPPAPAVAVAPVQAGPIILSSPMIMTVDGSTATLSVSGGELTYSISLSPTIASDGKLLVLWNIRLSGKSLPGATGVSATGATRLDTAHAAGIAVVSLTDPTNGRMATFRLQGTVVTGDAATAPIPVIPTPATAPPVPAL